MQEDGRCFRKQAYFGTSSTLLATDGTDDFKGGRRHLWKQGMIVSDSRNIQVTQLTHTKLIVVLW